MRMGRETILAGAIAFIYSCTSGVGIDERILFSLMAEYNKNAKRIVYENKPVVSCVSDAD